jgi:hypothetical protein
MSSKVQYVNNDILTDCVLAKDFKVICASPAAAASRGMLTGTLTRHAPETTGTAHILWGHALGAV